MNEREGCEVLERCFRHAGLAIARDYLFHEDGVKVTLDGFDPTKRVGFEFITTEAGDRAEFTPDVIDALETRMEAEELFLFLVDEQHISGEAALVSAAESFIALLRDRGKIA